MTTYTRGDVVVIPATFKAFDNSTDQPNVVNVYISYTDRSGNPAAATVGAILGTGVWTAEWDTTPAQANSAVYYTVKGTGPIQGAFDGKFLVEANPSNP